MGVLSWSWSEVLKMLSLLKNKKVRHAQQQISTALSAKISPSLANYYEKTSTPK
jgi:hypothetical protein